MSAELALAKLEASVLALGGVGRWLRNVDTLRILLARESPDIKAIVLAMVMPNVEQQAKAAVLDAFGLGARDALTLVDDVDPDLARTGKPSKDALAIVKGFDKEGRKAMSMATKLARSGAADLDVLAPIFGHANSVRGRVIESVNMSGNEGATAVADAADMSTVWVAETDACVECLAYSGLVAPVGGYFPGGLTYGRRSYNKSKLKHPPRHPRCRCTVEPLRSTEYADALRREADRSVLRGFSLASESMGKRLDAADRLLERGVDAPKSVVAFANRSVKAGAFPTRGRPTK
jgi:hypothetical protein